MDVFDFRDRMVADYQRFTRGFTTIGAPDIEHFVEQKYAEQHYGPAPLIQLNPSFVRGKTVEELVAEPVLEPEGARIFRQSEIASPAVIVVAKGEDASRSYEREGFLPFPPMKLFSRWTISGSSSIDLV